MKTSKQNPTPRGWKSLCEDIRDGYVWNLAMLNAGESGPLKIDHRIVDFRDIYTIPITFLESLMKQRGGPRLSLNPPYREHLSQAFARFFMRVGLPSPGLIRLVASFLAPAISNERIPKAPDGKLHFLSFVLYPQTAFAARDRRHSPGQIHARTPTILHSVLQPQLPQSRASIPRQVPSHYLRLG